MCDRVEERPHLSLHVKAVPLHPTKWNGGNPWWSDGKVWAIHGHLAIWLKSRPETEPVKSWQVTHSYHWPSQPLFLMIQDKAQVGIQGDPNILWYDILSWSSKKWSFMNFLYIVEFRLPFWYSPPSLYSISFAGLGQPGRSVCKPKDVSKPCCLDWRWLTAQGLKRNAFHTASMDNQNGVRTIPWEWAAPEPFKLHNWICWVCLEMVYTVIVYTKKAV